ncbi:unnamed protein product [Lota lota]
MQGPGASRPSTLVALEALAFLRDVPSGQSVGGPETEEYNKEPQYAKLPLGFHVSSPKVTSVTWVHLTKVTSVTWVHLTKVTSVNWVHLTKVTSVSQTNRHLTELCEMDPRRSEVGWREHVNNDGHSRVQEDPERRSPFLGILSESER